MRTASIPTARWLGVDVGGRRKGFDVAVVDDCRLADLQGALDCDAVISLVEAHCPTLVGIDSPRCYAPDGLSCRHGERRVAKEVCGIRWTPDQARTRGNAYYGWIDEGLRLYEQLCRRRVDVIEVFPTASWTRWFGRRLPRSRAQWTRQGLAALALEGVPTRTNQDQRDAIAAAVTARQHSFGLTESLGEIVVPVGEWHPDPHLALAGSEGNPAFDGRSRERPRLTPGTVK